ncbi:MAG: hypothetical protein GKS05_11190 [Nitrospirales bacterium]|nr:hypothetical protein [Nitrospirales bacterium]
MENASQVKAMMGLIILMSSILIAQPSQAEHLFALKLEAKPFSVKMCKKMRQEGTIRVTVANHRDIIIRKFPGQYIPKNPNQARKKNYVHHVFLKDLTNGQLRNGSIVFNSSHAVITTEGHPQGLSRPQFESLAPLEKREVIEKTFNTFLRLHPIFNAAIDACRPHPNKIIYETDDELLKIEKGQQTFMQLVQEYNAHPQPHRPLVRHETGKALGFVDPDAGKHTNVSYQAMNPLNFYVPIKHP